MQTVALGAICSLSRKRSDAGEGWGGGEGTKGTGVRVFYPAQVRVAFFRFGGSSGEIAVRRWRPAF